MDDSGGGGGGGNVVVVATAWRTGAHEQREKVVGVGVDGGSRAACTGAEEGTGRVTRARVSERYQRAGRSERRDSRSRGESVAGAQSTPQSIYCVTVYRGETLESLECGLRDVCHDVRVHSRRRSPPPILSSAYLKPDQRARLFAS